MESHYDPMVFTRHKLRLHALILERQAWFCLRDLGRFLGMFFEERITRKLAPDQRRYVPLRYYDEIEDVLMVSESAAYALLIYHGHPSHDPIRKWLTYQVLPVLRNQNVPAFNNAPAPGLLEWQRGTLSVLHWQDEPWIRLRDMPRLLQPGHKLDWWARLGKTLRGA